MNAEKQEQYEDNVLTMFINSDTTVRCTALWLQISVPKLSSLWLPISARKVDTKTEVKPTYCDTVIWSAFLLIVLPNHVTPRHQNKGLKIIHRIRNLTSWDDCNYFENGPNQCRHNLDLIIYISSGSTPNYTTPEGQYSDCMFKM